jgi:hypothetical protein
MGAGLDSHHRNTLEKILRHPASGNTEWREVVSLLEAAGTVIHEPDGQLRVARRRDRGVSPAARQGHRRADDRRPAAYADEGARRMKPVTQSACEGRVPRR